MDKKEMRLKYGEIVAKCWEDEEFKKNFINDPEEIFKEYGMDLPEGIEYKVIVAPKDIEYIIIPAKEVKEAAQGLAKFFLQSAETADRIVPEGKEIHILQNTESLSYVILPASPKTLTAAELARISGSGSADAEVEVEVVEVEATVSTTTTGVEVEVGVAVVCAAVLI